MSKTTGLTDKVRAGLRQGHHGQPQNLDPGDPVTVTQMVLPIDQIAEYEDNPRQQENPHYDEIKASIRAQRGINNSLEVTRRPGDENYIICSGGNTRLRILRELHAETGDEAFGHVNCLFHPWQGEKTVLTNHLVENELRGELALIDKALALENLRRLIEAEEGELSRNALITRLHELGYTTSKRQLIRHEFAARSLLPVIPTALAQIGGDTVDRIRSLYRGAQQLWAYYERDSDDLTVLWEQALADTDSPEWDYETGRAEIEARMAEALGNDEHAVRFELDAVLSGHQLPQHKEPASLATQGEDPGDSTGPADEAADTPGDAPGVNTPSTTPPSPEASAPPATTSSGTATEDDSSETTSAALPTVADMREEAYRTTRRIARRHQLQRYLHSWDRGMGYLIDLPEAADTPPEHSARQWVWWTLLALSEAAANPQHLPADYEVGRLAQDAPETLHARMGTPSYPRMGIDFLSTPEVTDGDIQDLMQLVRLCRQIHQSAHSGNPKEG